MNVQLHHVSVTRKSLNVTLEPGEVDYGRRRVAELEVEAPGSRGAEVLGWLGILDWWRHEERRDGIERHHPRRDRGGEALGEVRAEGLILKRLDVAS